MARRLGARFHSRRLNPNSRSKNANLQAWARAQRYQFLEVTTERHSYTHIAVAHQLDDRAETVAAAVLDAGGTFALSGIPPVRGKIIRPLFDVSRQMIETFLSEAGIPHRVDASNRSLKYQRNRIRHEIVPSWRRENPGIVSGLARLGEQAWMQRRFLEELAARVVERAVTRSLRGSSILDARKMSRYDSALDPYVLRELIRRLGLDIVPTPATVARFGDLRRSRNGKGSAAIEQGEFVVVRSQLFLKVSAKRARSANQTVTADTEIAAKLSTRIIRRPDATKSDDRALALFDLDTLQGAVSVRLPQSGDCYQPIGLRGTKKLFDLLADRKVPSFERPLVPLVVDDQGILWPVGHPIAHRARLTSRTRRVLEARVLEGSWKKRS
jgi:tRNA(Ile)-lysidine synthase